MGGHDGRASWAGEARLLSEEDDVRLDQASVQLRELEPAARPLLARLDGGAQLLYVDCLARVDTVRAVEVAVRGDDLLPGQPGRGLERVNVLREAAEQHALVVQQPDEVVHGRGVVVVRPQLACQ